MTEIESLKAQLAAAKAEILFLTIRLTNAEFLYRQTLEKAKTPAEKAKFPLGRVQQSLLN